MAAGVKNRSDTVGGVGMAMGGQDSWVRKAGNYKWSWAMGCLDGGEEVNGQVSGSEGRDW